MLNEARPAMSTDLPEDCAEGACRDFFHAVQLPLLCIASARVMEAIAIARGKGVADGVGHAADFARAAMETSVVIEANAAAGRLYGASDPSELLGPMSRLLPEGDAQAVRRLVAGFVGGAGAQGEAMVRRLDGSEVDVLLFVTTTPHLQEKGIVLAGHIDISEHASTRAALDRQRTELAQAARDSILGELAASIAHQINQPLTAITTNTEAGLHWLDRTDPDLGEIRSLMGRIVTNADRAAEAIRRLRGRAAQPYLGTQVFAIDDAIEEASKLLQHDMQANHVALTLDLAEDLPAVDANRVQVLQVIVNLATNAIQALAGVPIERRRIRIATETADAFRVLVRVEDSGPGISPDGMLRLFDGFYSTKGGALGLGLPICQSIVESHGGRIAVANNASAGACVTFTLPIAGPGLTGPE